MLAGRESNVVRTCHTPSGRPTTGRSYSRGTIGNSSIAVPVASLTALATTARAILTIEYLSNNLG